MGIGDWAQSPIPIFALIKNYFQLYKKTTNYFLRIGII